jgi:hypothetical protein
MASIRDRLNIIDEQINNPFNDTESTISEIPSIITPQREKRRYNRSSTAVKVKIQNEPDILFFDSIPEMADKLKLNPGSVYSSLEEGHQLNFRIYNSKTGISHKFDYVKKIPAYIKGVPIATYRDIWINAVMETMKITKDEATILFLEKNNYSF